MIISSRIYTTSATVANMQTPPFSTFSGTIKHNRMSKVVLYTAGSSVVLPSLSLGAVSRGEYRTVSLKLKWLVGTYAKAWYGWHDDGSDLVLDHDVLVYARPALPDENTTMSGTSGRRIMVYAEGSNAIESEELGSYACGRNEVIFHKEAETRQFIGSNQYYRLSDLVANEENSITFGVHIPEDHSLLKTIMFRLVFQPDTYPSWCGKGYTMGSVQCGTSIWPRLRWPKNYGELFVTYNVLSEALQFPVSSYGKSS